MINNSEKIKQCRRILFLLGVCCFLLSEYSFAITKNAIVSGNWSNPALWSPSGTPVATDDIVILSGVSMSLDINSSVRNVTVNNGGSLLWQTGQRLTLTAAFTVNGFANLNGGLITLTTLNPFRIGPG